jgi:hypothetical protein
LNASIKITLLLLYIRFSDDAVAYFFALGQQVSTALFFYLHSNLQLVSFKKSGAAQELTRPYHDTTSEAESKEKHSVWDPVPELTITSPYVHSRIDSNTFTMGNPVPESTCRPKHYARESTLSPPVRDFGFGLSSLGSVPDT